MDSLRPLTIRMFLALLLCLPLAAQAQTSAHIAAGSQVLWLQPDGSVWASGDADPVRGDTDPRARRVFRQIAGLARIHSIAINHNASDSAAAIDADGALWLWGKLSVLACAKDCSDSLHQPRRYTAIGRVRAVALGENHLLAIGLDGKVRSAGANDVGQLGNGTPQHGSAAEQRVARTVEGLSDIVAVAAQGDTSLILRGDGTVWGMGSSRFGLLGRQGLWKALDFADPPQPQPIRLQGLEQIKAISLGRFHALALDAKGQVWGWGGNESAQLVSPARDLYPQAPRVLPDFDGAVAIAAGDDYSLVLKRGSGVWARGGNVYGTLGDGGDELEGDLRQIEALKGKTVVALFAGDYNAFARLVDGSMLGWGANGASVGGFDAGSGGGTLLPTTLDRFRQLPAASAAVKAGAASVDFVSELGSDQIDEHTELWIDGVQAAVLDLDRSSARSHRGQTTLELMPGVHAYELRGSMRVAAGETRVLQGSGVVVVTARGIEADFQFAANSRGLLDAYEAAMATVRAVLPQLDSRAQLQRGSRTDAAALDAFEAEHGWKLPQAYRELVGEFGGFSLGEPGNRYPSVALYTPEQFLSVNEWTAQALARVPELDAKAALSPRDHDMLDGFRVHAEEIAAARQRLAGNWQEDRLGAMLGEAVYMLVPKSDTPCGDGRARQRIADFFEPEMDEASGAERYFTWADTAECTLDLRAELQAAVFAHYTAALRANGAVFVRVPRQDEERQRLITERLNDSGKGVLNLRLGGGEAVAE